MSLAAAAHACVPGSLAAPAAPATATGDPAYGDSTDGFPIRQVDLTIYDVFEPVPVGRLGPVYRLANRLHIRTRPGTLREQLLFEPGGRWSAERGRETARNLRKLDFLTTPRPIEASRAGDSVDVRVVTRDVWSTSPEFNLESFEGRAYGSVAFTERNLLGYGKALSFTYREIPTGVSRSILYDDPGVWRSRARFRYAASKGSLGSLDQYEVGVPFFSLDTPWAFQVSGVRTSSIASLFQRSAVAAEFDRELHQTEAWWGRGWRDGPTIRRLVGSFRASDRRLGPSRLQPGAPPEFDGPRERLKLRRFALEGKIWRPHFIERTNVDRMHLIEDFDVGPSLSATIGFSPRAWEATAAESYAALRLDLGVEAPFGFGWVRTDVSSRVRGGPVETIERVDARWVGQPNLRRTWVVSAFGIRGSRTPRDFQAVVGGLNGLRAYPVQAVAGDRLWRLNAEHRWTIGENLGELVTIGVVAFSDAARAWGAGATGTGWFVSSGAGVRLSLPQLSLGNMVRFDVAFPLDPTRDGRRKPVFSIGSSQGF